MLNKYSFPPLEHSCFSTCNKGQKDRAVALCRPGFLNPRADVWGRVSLCRGGERSCTLQHLYQPTWPLLSACAVPSTTVTPSCKNQKDVSRHCSLSPGRNGCPHMWRPLVQTLAGGLIQGDLCKTSPTQSPFEDAREGTFPSWLTLGAQVLGPHQCPIPTDARSILAAESRSRFCFAPASTALNLTQPKLSCFAFPSAHRA